jgi:hypothetical protein
MPGLTNEIGKDCQGQTLQLIMTNRITLAPDQGVALKDVKGKFEFANVLLSVSILRSN